LIKISGIKISGIKISGNKTFGEIVRLVKKQKKTKTTKKQTKSCFSHLIPLFTPMFPLLELEKSKACLPCCLPVALLPLLECYGPCFPLCICLLQATEKVALELWFLAFASRKVGRLEGWKVGLWPTNLPTYLPTKRSIRIQTSGYYLIKDGYQNTSSFRKGKSTNKNNRLKP